MLHIKIFKAVSKRINEDNNNGMGRFDPAYFPDRNYNAVHGSLRGRKIDACTVADLPNLIKCVNVLSTDQFYDPNNPQNRFPAYWNTLKNNVLNQVQALGADITVNPDNTITVNSMPTGGNVGTETGITNIEGLLLRGEPFSLYCPGNVGEKGHPRSGGNASYITPGNANVHFENAVQRDYTNASGDTYTYYLPTRDGSNAGVKLKNTILVLDYDFVRVDEPFYNPKVNNGNGMMYDHSYEVTIKDFEVYPAGTTVDNALHGEIVNDINNAKDIGNQVDCKNFYAAKMGSTKAKRALDIQKKLANLKQKSQTAGKIQNAMAQQAASASNSAPAAQSSSSNAGMDFSDFFNLITF